MEKKIIVGYWYKRNLEGLNYEHNQEFDYTKRKRNAIIDKVIDNGYNVMIQTIDERTYIWIDDRRFQQR